MAFTFVVGLTIPWKMRVLGPWVVLTVTPDALEFRARLGLDRFFGPWKLERTRITRVFKRSRTGIRSTLGIYGEDNLDWTLHTSRPDEILLCLEEFGYPVDAVD